jgi:3-deoxy-D-manno-octulosonic-acid transferase
MEIAEKAFPKHTVFYFPLDFTWAVRNAMQRLQPTLLVLVELEVWPNLVVAAKRVNCAIAIVNGRLSKRSFDRYFRLRWLLSQTFAMLDIVAVQDQVYAERFRAMGVHEDRVVLAGNMKFDGAISDRAHPEVLARRHQLSLTQDDCLWVVGSTQAPEEQYAIDAFCKLRLDYPRCKLILVPRQPDRFDEVARLIASSGLKMVRRSRMGDEVIRDWDVLLGDTIGELRWWWGLADLAFVGGSFGDRGGQNMIEPAAFGVSTAVGPNTKNFTDTVRILLEAEGLKQLSGPAELYDWARQNIASPDYRHKIGKQAREATAAHRGALEMTLDALAPFLEPKK